MLNARLLLFLWLPVLLAVSSGAVAQREPSPAAPVYARVNSFGLLAAYSNDSSHMFIGQAEQRKILNIGASYSRRLILNRYLNWQYDGEILPVALDSDPVQDLTVTITYTNPPNTVTGSSSTPVDGRCVSTSETVHGTNGTTTYVATYTFTCTRRWVYGGGLSPIGFRWNFLPRRSLQPLLVAHGGFMGSTQQIPIPGAGTFNFTFDIGTGFEWYRTQSRSLRFEWRYHHISNAGTASVNPGIDSGLFQVSYVFGR